MTAPGARWTVSFDRVADRYDASRGGHARAEMTVAAIAPWLTASGPVIEVGVGTGLIASKLAARGCSVVAAATSRGTAGPIRSRAVVPRLSPAGW